MKRRDFILGVTAIGLISLGGGTVAYREAVDA